MTSDEELLPENECLHAEEGLQLGPCLWKWAGLDDWNLLDLWFNEPHSDNVAAMFCLSFDKGAVGSVDGRSCRVETLGDNLKGL